MATITPSKLRIKKQDASDEYLFSLEDMTGASSNVAGAHGFVPAPAAGDNTKFLKGDGTWGTPDQQDISGKADKVSGATNGNFAALDSNGNLTDSGHKHSDYLTSHQDISGKADKDTDAVTGNFASFDASGNPVDSGHKHSDYLTSHQDISGKADKVTSAVNGNFAALDSNGNLTDSGHKHSDYLTEHQDISGKLNVSEKGAANGVAELDQNGKILSSELPSYVDDVLEYDSLSEFPATGESGKIYVAKNTNKTYRWSGTTYVIVGGDLALGETSSTAYRGDRGKAAYDAAVINPDSVPTENSANLVKSGGVYSAISAKYTKPSTGIPASDIASGVIPDVSGKADGAASSTADHIATFADATGKVLKDSGFTIATSVPANAVFTDTTYNDMTGAGSSEAGVHGLVPAPAAGDQNYFLTGAGTWALPETLRQDSVTMTVTNVSGLYSGTVQDASISVNSKPIVLEFGDQTVFRGPITVTPSSGQFTVTCPDVVGTTTLKITYLTNTALEAVADAEGGNF